MAWLDIDLLGPLRVTLAGGVVPAFRSDKERALLAYLAVESAHAHRREALAGLLWPEQPERAALNNLRTTLYRLRRALDDEGASPLFLLVTPRSIQFNTDSPHAVDQAVFEAHLGLVRLHRHRHADRCSECLARLETATRLYRGDFLQGFSLPASVAFEEWLRVKREQLRLAALDALHQLAKLYERRGEFDRVQTLARHVLELEPWSERAHRQLMRALARSERRVAALAQYEACRQALASELRVEPEPETVHLYEKIRRGDAWEAVSRPAHNLPAQLPPLYGRESALAHLGGLLLDPAERLISLVGEGGVGKTWLAIQAAGNVRDDFEDGVWFVSLAGLSSDGLGIPEAVATAMGLTFYGKSNPKTQLLNFLCPRECLLVLDNFEHVMAGAALVADILDAAPRTAMLVTSRAPLKFQAERVFRVEGLPVPSTMRKDAAQAYSSIQLFVERARRAAGDFALTSENVPAVIQVCRLIDGLPLGIILAASQMESQSPESTARAIQEKFDALAVAMHDLPPRQRSIRAVFESSWQLLSAAEQSGLAQVSVFRGGFTPEAVQAVTETAPADLAALIDQSMLRQTPAGRYEIHEMLRQFAAEKLAGQTMETRDRHLKYYLHLAEAAQRRLRSTEQLSWLDVLDAETDNLRAALQWAEASEAIEEGYRLGAALYWFWRLRGYWIEGRNWLDRFLKRGQTTGTSAARAGALVGSACLAMFLGDYEATSARARESAAGWHLLGLEGRGGLAQALFWEGMAAYAQTDYGPAEVLFEKSAALSRAANDDWALAMTLAHLGALLMSRGEVARAKIVEEESRYFFEKTGDRWSLTWTLNYLAGIDTRQAHFESAYTRYEEVLRIRREFRDRGGTALVLSNLGELARAEGDYARARALYEESLAIYRELGSSAGIALLIHNLAHVARAESDCRLAAALFKESLGMYEGQGNQLGVAMGLAGLAETLVVKDSLRQGQVLRQALILFSATAALLARLGVPLDPADQADYDHHLEATRAMLDPAEQADLWAHGQGLSYDEAIAMAMLLPPGS